MAGLVFTSGTVKIIQIIVFEGEAGIAGVGQDQVRLGASYQQEISEIVLPVSHETWLFHVLLHDQSTQLLDQIIQMMLLLMWTFAFFRL